MPRFLRTPLRPFLAVSVFIFLVLFGYFYWSPFSSEKDDTVQIPPPHSPDVPHHPSSPPVPSDPTPPYLPVSSSRFLSATNSPSPYTILSPNPISFEKRTDVGKLPALGWNSWNAYRCDITEERILSAARSIVDLGLREAGYKYINLDDCWSLPNRSEVTGRLTPDPLKFPRGISYVAKEVHALGLKLGIYADAGDMTCAKYPGSLGFEEVDAKTWEEWGVDYLKYDNCNIPLDWMDSIEGYVDWRQSRSYERFARMGKALANLETPLEYSLCIWGTAKVWLWGKEIGHSWRMGDDSEPDWVYLGKAIRHNAKYLPYVDFWAHNDMDMMEIGNVGKEKPEQSLTLEEEKTHFTVWAFMKSPILLGTELGSLSSEQLDIVKNKMLLEFNQDEVYGRPAVPFASRYNNVMLPENGANFTAEQPPVFFSGLSNKGVGVFAINWGGEREDMTIIFGEVPELIYGGEPTAVEGGGGFEYEVTDMWTGEMGRFRDRFVSKVPGHGTLAVLVRRLGVDDLP